ncbi:MAG: hypothetical protein GF308_21980 [Candidatus Heimdallarchaeota archaeon]|nr:hypothetical protein [Candidatus Heimdallarchaeota archaeon]
MVVNVLSKSTWKADIGENVDYCKLLEIPLYVVFATFHVATAFYRPPFLRAYILQEDGSYNIQELRELTVDKQGEINTNAIIDTSANVPFRLGLMKQKKQHEGGLPLYRMILLDKEELRILPTELEKQMEEEKERADKLKQRVEKAEAKIRQLEEELEKVREKND